MVRFLIIRTSALGDILHGMPVAAALKERYPRSEITWVVDERYQPLLAGHPCVDRILLVRFKEGFRTLRDVRGRRNWTGLVRMLRDLRFDVAIDVQGLFRSGCISYLSRARVRIGFPQGHVREKLNLLFTNVRPRSIPPRSHVIDRNLALLHPLGVFTKQRRFALQVPPPVEESVRRFLRETETGKRTLRVVVHPAAGWTTKQWGPKRYAEIADRILESWDASVFLLWGPGERQTAEQVQAQMQRSGRLVPDMGLTALVAFLRECDLFIGGDSGPLHLASALAVPVLGLYGPSDPVRNGPFQAADQVVTASPLCGPCDKRRCARSTCMDSIAVEQVWETLTGMAESIAKRPKREDPVFAQRNG